MAEQIRIAELSINSDEIVSSLRATKSQIDELSKSQKSLKDTSNQNTAVYIEQEAALKSLKSEYNAQSKALQATQQATINLTKAVNQEVKSVNEAKNNNAELVKMRNQVNVKTVEGQKQLKDINKKMDDNNKLIKDNVSGLEKQKINIGNYASGLAKTNPLLANMIDILTQVKAGLIGQAAAMKAADAATGNTSKALRVFKLALIATGIGAVVVVLGALITYLSSTQAGIDKVTSVTRPLQAIFSSLVGVAQTVGESMFNAFSKPKVLLNDLVNFIKGQVMNRLNAMGMILDGIINLDFNKIKDGFVQGATGVEDFIDKAKAGASAVGTFFKDAAAAGTEIDKLTKSIEQGENNLLLLKAKNSKLIKDQEALAKDTSKSGAERLKAANEAQRLTNESLNAELSLIDQKIALEEKNQALNDSGRADEKLLNELKAQRYAAEEQAQAQNLKFISARTGAFKEEQAQEKERLKVAEEKVKAEEEAAKKAEEDKKAAEEKELARIEAFETAKRDLENKIALEREENDLAKAELALEQEYEKNVLALENMELSEQEKTDLLLLMEEDRALALAKLRGENAKKVLADATAQGIAEKDLAASIADAKVGIASSASQALATIFGNNSLIAKAAFLVEKGFAISSIWANNAVANAKAIAASPLTFGQPWVTANTAQAIAGTVSIAGQVFNAIAPPKPAPVRRAANGMLVGRSHAEGGIHIEAEGGEAIINKRSSAMYRPLLSALNEAGGGVKFANGGMVGGSSMQPSSSIIDYNQLAEVMASMPAPRVAVDEISSVGNRVKVIESQASFG